jgi:uncharacterized protein (DUF305 family)
VIGRRLRASLTTSVLALTLAAPGASPQTSPAKSGPGYTAADVQFMQGMIGHHAQAIVMAKMCPSHGASARLLVFCDKIIRSQRDEIELMETWLRDRGEAVPDTAAGTHAAMAMDMKDMKDMKGMAMGGHSMLMPGMLTPEQLAALDRARGTDFDRLFLTDMIQHHEGALTMVATLFDSPGAGQTPEIFGYATGVDNDQRAEIGRMQGMLTTITGAR